MKNLNIKFFITLTLSFLLAIFLIIFSLRAKAQSTTLTGSCGAVFGLNNPTQALWEYANKSVDKEGLNAMAIINFDSNTISYELVEFIVTAPSNGRNSSSTINNMSFTVTNHPTIANIKKITLANAESFNILPINSNNTYLIQGITFASTGVCSKI